MNIKEKNKSCIVVLGMHRSGTSLITKGINELGVHLGDNLIDGRDDNPKGYWEDKQIIELNERILSFLDMDIFNTRPISKDEIDNIPQSFIERGIEIIQSLKICKHFGFKDPRTARLLIFWQKVFVLCNIEPRYIVAIRNPISIANSLEKRDGLHPTHAQLLWLMYIVPSLFLIKDNIKILVDYDDFIENPELNLKYISLLLLGKEVNKETQNSVSNYCKTFVNPNLRHNINSTDTLKISDQTPSLAKKAYLLLSSFCLKTSFNNTKLNDLIDELYCDLLSLYPLCFLIDYQYNIYKNINIKCINLENSIHHFNNTRTAKFQRWLSTHPIIESVLVFLYEGLKISKNILTQNISKTQSNDNKSFDFYLEINDPTSNILAICHPNWQGVRSATEGQSRNHLFLPDLAETDIQPIVDLLANQIQRTVIFNGFWRGYDLLMTSLKEHFNNIHILYVHHGSLYQLKETREGPTVLDTIYKLNRKRIIDRVGFVKKGMPEAFYRLGGEAWYVMNYVEPEPNPLIKTLQHPIRVGIPVEDSLRKNPHTQIIAALLIPDVDEVHIWHQPDISYLKSIGIDVRKIVVHSNCTREKTRALLNKMTFTMYVTISECFPMVVLESFAAATPCFSGYTHGILDDIPELAKSLMIPYPDNPVAIANHIQEHLPNITVLSKHVLDAYSKLSNDAQQNIRQFADFSNQQ